MRARVVEPGEPFLRLARKRRSGGQAIDGRRQSGKERGAATTAEPFQGVAGSARLVHDGNLLGMNGLAANHPEDTFPSLVPSTVREVSEPKH